jgi:hypothetical protein
VTRSLFLIDKAILEQSMMGQLAEPSPESLRSLQHWLERPKMGGSALIGKDKDSWGDASEPINPHHDLLSVVCNKETDKFSAWFSQNILRSIYHLIWLRVKSHKDLESGVLFYQNDTLQKFTSYFAIIVASLLPILAIAVLYSVESMKARLGLVALFIVIFASCLSIFTYAARSEIFIATST